VHFLEGALEIGCEGVFDLGAQGLGDVADVVEQLGGRALGVVLQLDQARVQCAQLLVGRECGFIGRLEL
jgi:hypothetical protein